MYRNAIYIVLLSVVGLTALGLVMLFSTSAFAQESRGDMYYFVKRQALWLMIGLVAAAVAASVDYHLWRRLWWVFCGGALILLVLCFVPPIGLKINGSHRWIGLGPVTFQPSEVAKLAAIFFLAWWFEKNERQAGEFLRGFVVPLAGLAVLVVPILFEVDLGTSALIVGMGLAVMFVAGTSLRWLVPMGVLAAGAVIYLATHIEERQGRLMAFLNPEQYEQGEGYQQLQALIALGSGGVHGLGLGEGMQKMLYLPYAHTDFIFPMIGEELGLRFTLLTVLGFLLLTLCGTLVAMNARDRFGMLVGFGCVMVITLQAVINIGVTTSLLPNKGMPLPFISSGGSNLAMCFLMIGILVNIHRQGRPLINPMPAALRRAPNFCRM